MTLRMFDLSIPIPKAMVATMMEEDPRIKSSWILWRSSGERPA
jgi:hypothetical protein